VFLQIKVALSMPHVTPRFKTIAPRAAIAQPQIRLQKCKKKKRTAP
jgi:hypothetical protein